MNYLDGILRKKGESAFLFGDACDALGVVFNLQASSTGIAHISNTASRVEEIVAEIIRVTGAGSITLPDAQKLRGRMQFAEAQLYGRTGKRCLQALRDACCRKRTKFVDHEILSLRLFAKMLEMGKPELSPGTNVTLLLSSLMLVMNEMLVT